MEHVADEMRCYQILGPMGTGQPGRFTCSCVVWTSSGQSQTVLTGSAGMSLVLLSKWGMSDQSRPPTFFSPQLTRERGPGYLQRVVPKGPACSAAGGVEAWEGQAPWEAVSSRGGEFLDSHPRFLPVPGASSQQGIHRANSPEQNQTHVS